MSILNFLPRTPVERCMLGVLSLCLLALSAPFVTIFAWALLFPARNPPAIDPFVRVFLVVVEEFCFVLFVVCLLGVIWALCAPAWVERCIDKAGSHLLLTLPILIATGAILYCIS